jgi:PAS domain S-box-containing protein
MRLPIRDVHSVGILAILTIAAIVTAVTLLIFGLRDRELRHARLEMESLTNMLMEQTEQNIKSTDLALQGVQERLNTAYGSQFPLDSVPIHLLLSNRLFGLRHLRAIFILDAQGMLINSSRELPVPKASSADREYFKTLAQSKSGALFIDKPVRNRFDNSWSLNLSRALLGSDGQFRGVVVAVVGVSQLEQLFDVIKLDYSRPIGIYLADGTLIASLPHRENMIGEKAPELNKESLPDKGSEVRSIRHTSGDGTRVEMVIGRLPSYPLLLSVTEDAFLALASWRETAVPIAIGGVMVSIFTAIAAMVLISKQKSKEALTLALAAANDLYQHTVDSVMDAIVAIDEFQNVVLFNPAAENMFGLKAEQVLGKPFEILIPERMRTAHTGHVRQFAQADSDSRTMARQLEITGWRADGQEFPIESTVSKSMIGGKLQMTAVLRDMTERRRAEIELREVNSQLRQLSTSLQSVREQERTRLSRELHDELGQQLTGLKLSLSWLTNRIRDGRAATLESVAEMREQLNTAISAVRRISTELRPLILDDLGFEEAISWHCQEFNKHSNLVVTLNLQAAKDVTDDDVATALFRIVQESLTNVARHSNANQVNIDLTSNGETLLLTIHDNGQGIQEHPATGGIGLVSMRERAISIGATFRIISKATTGTTIEVAVPLNLSERQGVTA